MPNTENNLELFDTPEDFEELMAYASDPEVTKRWPQGLTDLIDVIEAAHQKAGDEPDTARERAFRVVLSMAHYFGGQIFYIPRGENLHKFLRNRRIWEAHNGRNQYELAAEHGMTIQQLYNILAEQRRLHVKRNQRDMFDTSADD